MSAGGWGAIAVPAAIAVLAAVSGLLRGLTRTRHAIAAGITHPTATTERRPRPMSDMSGARQVLRACADAGGWPWCDEHQAPRWHSAAACAPRHHDALPGGPDWCFTCERMHKPMEWGDGCQDWQDARAAEIEAEVTGHERTARRYRRASKTVEAAAGVLFLAMAGVLLVGDGPTVGSVAAGLLLAAIAVYLCSWPLQRRSARAGWQAMETRWEARREKRTFALDNREARFTPSGEIQRRDEEVDRG